MKKQVLASLVAISLSPAAFAQDDEVKPFTMEGELGFISTSGNTETTSISAGIQAHQELEKWSNDYVLKGLYKQETVQQENDAALLSGRARTRIGIEQKLIDDSIFKFCWVVDYPMFEKDEQTGKIEFSHNPFSMPQGGMDALEKQDPLDIKAWQYDLVCNGIELSSGAIRNHLPEVMYRAFDIAGYGPKVVDEKFPAMIGAFKFGAPPHGGIAPGIDRMVMLIAEEPNIREIILFPMNGKAEDLMMSAPSVVDDKQLNELYIRKAIIQPKTPQ